MRVTNIGAVLAMLMVALPATAQTEVRQGSSSSRPTDSRSRVPAETSRRLPLVTDKRFDEGMLALKNSEPQRAFDMMEPLLADFTRRYSGEKRQIYCAVTREQTIAYMALAATQKRDAVAVEPGWCRAQYIHAYALVDLGKLEEAQQSFERLVAYAPENSRYLNELAYLLQKKKLWQQSLDMYRQSESFAGLSPDSADNERCTAFRGIGYNLVELGNYDEAEVAYRKCLAIDPDDQRSQDEIDYIRKQRKNNV